MSQPPQTNSMLLVEEYFDQQDERFIEALRAMDNWKSLAAFAKRWKQDHRPWARQQIFAYLQQPLNCLGHQPIVKQLFKQAEEAGDEELLGAFMVAFDRLVRYQRRTRWHYEWETRRTWQEEFLRLPRNTTSLETTFSYLDPWSRKTETRAAVRKPQNRLFSHRTRYYLRRRAWRYFRLLGFSHADRYCTAVAQALIGYQDYDLATGEDILENWGLMHACFGKSQLLETTPAHIRLAEDASFDELQPAPYFLELWQTETGFDVLLNVLSQAESQLVRTWSRQLIERHHTDRLRQIDLKRLLPLLDNDDETVVEFAAQHFSQSSQLPSLTLDDWFRLLETRNIAALELICRSMHQHVHGERLSLSDCIRLACAAPVPVSQMGVDWLRQRPVRTDEDREALLQCAQSSCVATASDLTNWVLQQVGTPENYNREHASIFLDSLNSACRGAAWDWLTADNSPGRDDPALWARLVETPYDDIRLPLIDVLYRRSISTGISGDALTPVWSSVLAGVHRGGRTKLKAIQLIKQAVLQNPDRLESLLPVLAVAVRSVREPEMAAGLAAIVELAAVRPELAPAVQNAFPELQLSQETV